MHIAVVTKNMAAGGAERVIAQLINEWCAKGISCSLILLNKNDIFYSEHPDARIIEIGALSENRYVDKLARYRRVRKILRGIKPDVVLSMPEEIGVFVIAAMLGTKIPIVVSERNNPWVMPNKKATRIVRYLTYPFADGLIFQTEKAASFFTEAQQKKGAVLPNPLECSRLPEASFGGRRKEIIGAGRLEPQKNFPLLIKAFAKFYETHSDYKLVIYGEGSERRGLEKMAGELLPTGAWSLPGRDENLPCRIKNGSVFVLSSDFEGVPNVLIEAMAVGTPCVSTDCAPGGAAELIKNGENGLLVHVGDADALAEGLCFLVEHNDAALKMAKNAVAIREKLDSERVAEAWLNYLKKCASRK